MRFSGRARLLWPMAAALTANVPSGGAAAPAPVPTPAEAPATPPADDTPDDPAPTPAGPLVVDLVLPCGVRLIALQDLTLPVAAIALAVETGTEDDPSDAPGLVHALAYHMLQGNREYAPSGIARAVHGNGGTTSLAIGPAQVRYESLVPASMLAEMIAAEASRLRAPTVSAALWKDTLRWARRDRARAWSIPAALRVAAHEAEGLAHDGHAVTDAIESLSERAVSTQLAERFTYDRSTLIIVAPDAPEAVLTTVIAAFSDLPAAPRRARDRTANPQRGSAPRTTPAKAAPGTFVWAIPGDAHAQAWAEVVCGTLNRSKRGADEPSRARLRCAIDDDARRGVMVLKVTGADDPQAMVRARLQRTRDNEAGNLVKELSAVAERIDYAVRTPLPMARHLARARSPGPAPGDPPTRPAAELVGSGALIDATAVPTEYDFFLDIGASTVAVDAAPGGAAPSGAPK